jgi:hypothetical protein
MDSPVYQEIIARGALEGRRALLESQLRRRLGKSKKADALVAGLELCSGETLEKIGAVLVESKKKDLPAAIERLIPKEPS